MVRYAPRTDSLYYTSTAQKLFMRVAVDPMTCEAVGEPEFVAGGIMGGTTAPPPDGIVRRAQVLRVEFAVDRRSDSRLREIVH
jgi:hypothetical protein